MPTMEFIKSWKFMAVIVGVLAAAAIAGVIYGVVTHTEPGLMAEHPNWSRSDFPLAVCVDTYAFGPAVGDDLDHAQDVFGIINERLGFSAFRLSHQPDCDVMLTYGVPTEPGWQDPGGSALTRPGFCDAVTANVSGELRTLSVEHELGHCLGLDHDAYRSSIMFDGDLVETPDGEFPPRISDDDRSLLRERYAPEN